MQASKVYLRAFEPDDYKQINAWRKDEEVYRLTGGNRFFVSSERDRQWVLDKILHNQTEMYLAICLTTNHSMIGYCSLADINYHNSRAEWSGVVIGEKDYRGQGYEHKRFICCSNTRSTNSACTVYRVHGSPKTPYRSLLER